MSDERCGNHDDRLGRPLYSFEEEESARAMLKQHGLHPHMVSKSRLSRRLHRIKELFIFFFDLLSHTWKRSILMCLSIDSSLLLCVTISVFGDQRYSKEDFRGYQASKKGYF